jgi:hypothetical protein
MQRKTLQTNQTKQKFAMHGDSFPAVEYFPWSDLNLKFFANWVGREYKYTDYAKTRFGAADYSTGRFTVGFITPLGIL